MCISLNLVLAHLAVRGGDCPLEAGVCEAPAVGCPMTGMVEGDEPVGPAFEGGSFVVFMLQQYSNRCAAHSEFCTQ